VASILVVDDDKDVVELLKFTLEKAGHTVAGAFSGAEALQVIGVDPPQAGIPLPDLIILDIMMPVMDGYTTAARLRENQDTRSIPLVIVTAKGKMRDIFEPASNVKAYIEKPFDPNQLRDLVSRLLPDGSKRPDGD